MTHEEKAALKTALLAFKERLDAITAEPIPTEKPKAKTIQDVYGVQFADQVGLPRGRQLKIEKRRCGIHTCTFRPPLRGEEYMVPSGMAIRATEDHQADDTPYLILEPLPPNPTIESVYGKPLSELKPPKGETWLRENGKVAFRPAVKGERFYPDCGGDLGWTSTQGYGPRLILVPCKRLVFDILEEGRRPPKQGEWAQAPNGSAIQALVDLAASATILSAPRIEEASGD
jgi:hypothetical protein